MTTPVIGTLESLRETLKQTLEEKQRIEQQAAEDMQRIDQRIASIQQAISGFITELQSLDTTIQSVRPDVRSEHMERIQADYQQLHSKPTQPLAAAEIRGTMRQNLPKSDAFEINIGKAGLYLIGIAVMFCVIWIVMSAMNRPQVQGCELLPYVQEHVQDRAQDRMQEWQEMRQTITHDQSERLQEIVLITEEDASMIEQGEQAVLPVVEGSTTEEASRLEARPRQMRLFQRLFR